MEAKTELLIATFKQLTIPIVLFAPDGTLVGANSAFRSLVSSESLPAFETYTHINQLFPGVSCDTRFHKRLATVLRTDSLATDSEVILDLLLVSEDCRAIVVISSESETERFHNQRLRTLGTLAGGIAHDFNNVLAGILGHISYLKTILPGTGPHRESLQAIEDGGKKASVMTKQISSFSKLDIRDRPVPVDLEQLVQGMCLILKGALSPEYLLKTDLPAGEGVLVKGVEGKLGQVIANLVMNARDALSVEGSITVAVKEEVTPPGLENISPTQEWCAVTVEDNGTGMPKEIVDRVFEPYFTTKKDQGTGLGLATVNALVHQMGGFVAIDSCPGTGTTVTCYFPRCSAAVEEDEAESSKLPVPAANQEYLLVVDDDDPVRNILGTSLGYLGYRIDRVSSGAEALKLLEAHPDRYDLVILDMLMPEMGGEEVYRKLHVIAPDLRVLVMSGYSSEEAVQSILVDRGNRFIQKPFTIEELSHVVRECLSDEPGR